MIAEQLCVSLLRCEARWVVSVSHDSHSPGTSKLARVGSSHCDTRGIRELSSNTAYLILLIKISHKANPNIRRRLKYNMPIIICRNYTVTWQKACI